MFRIMRLTNYLELGQFTFENAIGAMSRIYLNEFPHKILKSYLVTTMKSIEDFLFYFLNYIDLSTLAKRAVKFVTASYQLDAHVSNNCFIKT